MNLVVVGDSLLDRDIHGTVGRISPDAPVPVLDQRDTLVRPGGAALAAAMAASDGHRVTLVTALGRDDAARELRHELERHAVDLVDTGLSGSTPEKIRFFAGDQQLMRLDRGAGVAGPAAGGPAARAAIGWADAVLVSDYGRGVAADRALRAALVEAIPRMPVVWDPHPRGPRPVPGVTAATPNEAEAVHLGPAADDLTERVAGLRARWEADAVCVTRGARGALLVTADAPPTVVPAPDVPAGDSCGAGDRFASRLAGGLAGGLGLGEAVREAVAVSALFVAAGGARAGLGEARGAGAPADPDALRVARTVRAAGGTVVATGGCFDLLHAGHVSTLAAARRLGDCLIVCLNSDASVRRLKGPSRPLVPQDDRAAVLAALGSVDAVAVFDEETPADVLRMLRPHVWVKGGDYEGVRLPEAEVLAEWGGRAFVLPYLDGHSTTRLIQEAATSV